MKMQKEFVPYTLALELKELGFDEPCIMQWTYAPELIFCTSAWGRPKLKTNKESYSDSGGDCISAPTFSQSFRFFREKYKIGTWIHHYFNIDKGTFEYSWVITLPYKDDGYVYDTYEEAELACLNKLIEIIKSKQNG